MAAEPIASGARTVAHMATYFEELKQAARAFASSGDIAGRGYFKPGEEEQARQLQVSYWQSRCALFELIDAFRHDPDLTESDYPAAFLVAYAASLLLVDAARFLRQEFHELTPVRHKLDEPDEQFGIPPRMYDTVQRSLTSTRHAWHLYHAIGYFRANETMLREKARDGLLAPCVEVIDRLGDCVHVSLATFAKTKLRVRGRGLSRQIGRDVIGRAVYGLQKLTSSMMADVYVRQGHRPRLPRPIVRQLAARLEPGDILVVRKEYALTNYFLPGYWPHAALYLGDAAGLADLGLANHDDVRPRWAQLAGDRQEPFSCVLEAMKDGVRIRDVASPFAADSLVVLRPRLDKSDISQALARGLRHEGKPYDFDFDFNRSDRLVCTEVVYRAYDGIGPIAFQLTRRAGRNTLSAGDLVRMALAGRGFDPLFAYAPAVQKRLLEGPAAASAVRQLECGEEVA